MCGRYYLGDTTAREVEIELGVQVNHEVMKAGDITPAMNPMVLSATQGQLAKLIQSRL